MQHPTPRRLCAVLTTGTVAAGVLALGGAVAGPAQAVAAPVNDLRSGALPLPTLPVALSVDNRGATASGGDRWLTTVWYTYTAPTDRTVVLHAHGPFDNTLEVYDGTTYLDDNDDYYGLDSMLSWRALAGHTYYVAFGSFGGGTGISTLDAGDSPPDAPAAPTATAGEGSATVQWDAPADNGGSITSYTVHVLRNGQEVSSVSLNGTPPSTSTVVAGLEQGPTYTFTVSARNLVGESLPSAPSAPVLLATVPDAPTAVQATAGVGSASVSWTPAADGGAPVTGYTVRAFAGTDEVASTTVAGEPPATTATLEGLTNGTAYTFTVTATNAVGDSSPSAASDVVTLPTEPVAPSAVTAVPANGSATVRWTPEADGGTPLTGYSVAAFDGAEQVATAVLRDLPLATTTTVDGLTNGHAYTFVVTATNAVGGTSSVASAPVVPSVLQGAYQDRGAELGVLGAALTPEVAVAGGSTQRFAGGALYWSPATGVVRVYGEVLARYDALGGPAGLLGFPTVEETATTGAAGRVGVFSRGTVYWSPRTGAHEVHGLIKAEFDRLGGVAGPAGFPLTDEQPVAGGAGRASTFSGATVYWSPRTGAHEVHGAVLRAYAALGGPAGLLGFPLTGETPTPDGVGRFNHFASGSVYWSPSTGAHEVHGAIRAAWSQAGWERSWLGYPVSDEYARGPLRISDFTGGSARYDTRTGRTTLVRR